MFICTVTTLLFMVIVAVTVLVYLLLYCAFRNYSIVYCRRELCIVLDLAFTAIALVTVLYTYQEKFFVISKRVAFSNC